MASRSVPGVRGVDKPTPGGSRREYRMARPQAETDEDQLGELPPMDGDSDESGEAAEAFEKNLEVPPEDGGSDEDGASEHVPQEADVSIGDAGGSWLNEEPEASDLDLGMGGTIVEWGGDASPSDDDPPGGFEEDTELWEDSRKASLDSGDEGPLAADEELRDEDLPALDSDDEGEGADALFVDASFACDDPLGVPWASGPWPRVGAPLLLTGATSIACAGRSVVVALRAEERDGAVKRPSELAHVDLEGSYTVLNATGFNGADVEALANDGTGSGVVALVLRGGRLVTSRDGGAHFDDHPSVAATDCVVALGRVWVRTQEGSLLTLGSRGFERCSLPRRVTAIASEGAAAVVALMAPDEGGHWAIATLGPDAAWAVAPIADDAGHGSPRGGSERRAHAMLAARAGHIAYCARVGIVRRLAGGRWCPFSGWEGSVTALGFVDDRGTLLVATYSDVEDVTGLVRVDAAGRLSVVARIGALRDQGNSDGRVLSLACDDARGVVWLAGGFGVAAFSMGVD